MAQYTRTSFDASFAALSDATRAAFWSSSGAQTLQSRTLPKIPHDPHGHEKACRRFGAGGARHHGEGRARADLPFGLRRLTEEAAWIERYRQLWDARFDETDKVVEELKQKGEGRWTQEE